MEVLKSYDEVVKVLIVVLVIGILEEFWWDDLGNVWINCGFVLLVVGLLEYLLEVVKNFDVCIELCKGLLVGLNY